MVVGIMEDYGDCAYMADMDGFLSKFYAEVRKKDGTMRRRERGGSSD
jgi:hypothetical protein